MTRNKLKNSLHNEESEQVFEGFKEDENNTPKQIRNINQIAGVAVLIFGIMLGLAMISYIWTGRQDQSVVEELSIFDLSASGKEAANWLRLFGAYISHLFIFNLFGAAAYMIFPFVVLSGFDLMRNKQFRYGLFYKMSFFLFWVSALLGFFAVVWDGTTEWGFFCGGFGYMIASFFESLFGWATPLLLLMTLAVAAWYWGWLKFSSFAGSSPKKNAQNLQSNFETQRKNEEKADESSLNETKKREEDVEMTTNPTAITNETKEEQPSKVESIRLSRDPEEKKRDAEKLKKQTSKTIVEPQNIADEGLVEHEVSKLEGVSLPDDERDENADKVLLVDEVELTPDSESLFAEEFEPNVLQSKENSEETQSTVPLEKRVFKITKEEKKFDLHEQHFDPVNALTDYQMPGIELLDVVKTTKKGNTDEEIYENLNKIARTLEAFKISITDDVRAEIGPTVTLYEIVPAPGIKISQIRKVADDIALSLSAIGIRIIAPMPGRGTIGIEVPNKNREKVSLRALIESETFTNTRKELPIVFGKTISNDIFITDLAKMPHLLIGGATGQGKSVGINVVLTSLLYKKHPGELKFVLIDPKKVEFSIYDKLSKHYLAELPDSKSPVITDADESLRVLESLCLEMDNRYELLKNSDCRQILEYNRKFESGELDMTEGNRFLPYIVVVIDELADLMITTNKAIERPIARLAQMARAVGIHLVVATQRPSVNVITGVIKANFPARMAFKVTSKTDSRVILDVDGAEQLLGMGDMLLTNGSDIIRLQCAYVDTMEVERITNFIGEQKGYAAPYYLPEVSNPNKPKQQQFNLNFDPKK